MSIHHCPENPDCCYFLKRVYEPKEQGPFYTRKEKRSCDCQQLDCKHTFFHKSCALSLMRAYYKEAYNEDSCHSIFTLGTDIFNNIMEYAKYGTRKLINPKVEQNEGIIEFISKQNYKNEFINPYTLGIIQVNDVKFAVDYELQEDITSLFDSSDSNASESIVTPDSSVDSSVQYISGDELILTYPHHAIYPTAYKIQNGGVSALTSWILEGRVDEDSNWVSLDVHCTDPIFLNDIKNHKNTHSIHTWKIYNPEECYYTSFRIRNTSINPNTKRPYPLYINQIEFYGYVETFKVVSKSILSRYLSP